MRCAQAGAPPSPSLSRPPASSQLLPREHPHPFPLAFANEEGGGDEGSRQATPAVSLSFL